MLRVAQPSPGLPEYDLACSPADWEQIEDAEEVAWTIRRLQAAARFDVYTQAELYDLAYPGYEGDRDYYVEQAARGRSLYLGVGSGRIFAKIAERNPQAVGLDNSPEMLAQLRRRFPKLRSEQTLLADAGTADLPENSFDTVIAPFSFTQVVDAETLPKLLKNVARWLKPGGTFHTDTFSTYLIPFRRPGLERSLREVREDVRVAIYVTYDHLRQRMKEHALIEQLEEPDRVLEMDLQYYFPRELAAMFAEAGLERPEIHGGFRGEPFDPIENEVTVFVARKPAAGSPSDPPPSVV